MAFPTTPTSHLRSNNSAATVAKLLRRRHDGNFMVWNLSEESYDTSIFDNQVQTVRVRRHWSERTDTEVNFHAGMYMMHRSRGYRCRVGTWRRHAAGWGRPLIQTVTLGVTFPLAHSRRLRVVEEAQCMRLLLEIRLVVYARVWCGVATDGGGR